MKNILSRLPRLDADTAKIAMSLVFVQAAILSLNALPLFAARGGSETLIALALAVSLTLLAGAAIPRYASLRILAAALFLALEIFMSGDAIKNDQRPLLLIYAVVILALTTYERLPEGVLAARLTILATYFLAGVMKLIGFVMGCTQALCTTSLISTIYATNAIQSGREGILTAFMVGHPLLSLSTYVIAMCFQLAVLFLYVFDIGRQWIPYELILFHIAVYFVMGIDFFDNIILIFVLFLYADALQRKGGGV